MSLDRRAGHDGPGRAGHRVRGQTPSRQTQAASGPARFGPDPRPRWKGTASHEDQPPSGAARQALPHALRDGLGIALASKSISQPPGRWISRPMYPLHTGGDGGPRQVILFTISERIWRVLLAVAFKSRFIEARRVMSD